MADKKYEIEFELDDNTTKKVQFTVPAGDPGVGISKIEGPESQGLIDTYTITLANGTKAYFTVTNGKNGTTPTIEIKEGYWYINGTKSIKAQGEDGDPGAAGENGKTPTFKIENGNLSVSYDNGTTWDPLGNVQGADGDDYVLTDADKKDIAEKAVAILNDDGIPDYWNGAFTDKDGKTYTHYLDEKIADIKALQDEGGKDAFSFVVMTDIHYKQNLGRRSPAIAKKIMDECDIKFALCFGDVQNREPYSTKAQVEAEWGDIRTMFAPIAKNVLMQKGNHDGSWGTLNGTQYAFNFTPAELYNRVYASTYKHQNAVTDESGTAYYVDDTARKIRFIMLNTTCNLYEENEDGSAKYNNMTHARLTQTQFDFLTKNALVTVPDNDWSVILGGHHPLWKAELKDAEILIGVLGAYKSKSEDGYVGEYEGTADIGDAYKNLAVPNDTNTDDISQWVNNKKIGSTSYSTEEGTTICNPIEIVAGDVIRIKGVTFRNMQDRVSVSKDGITSGTYAYVSQLADGTATAKDYLGYEYTNDIHKFTILKTSDGGKYFRCAFATPTDASTVIITKNEEIKAGARYDAVSVNANFSEAKGNFIGYFCGHNHNDMTQEQEIGGILQVLTRCDAPQEHTEADRAERVKDTITEQSFDVFTVNKAKKKIYATKIGAGVDREIGY